MKEDEKDITSTVDENEMFQSALRVLDDHIGRFTPGSQAYNEAVALKDWFEKRFNVESAPLHSCIESVYCCGKEPTWKVGDTLAYYDYDGEIEVIIGTIVKVEFNDDADDWEYTWYDASTAEGYHTCFEYDLIVDDRYYKV